MIDLVTALGIGHAVLAVLVLGATPRLALRLIVLAHPRDTLLRDQIMADFEDVALLERPIWVASQLEVALIEGIGIRLSRSPDWFARKIISAVFRSEAIRDDLLEALPDVPMHLRPYWAFREGVSAAREGWRIRPQPPMAEAGDDRPWLQEAKSIIRPGMNVKVVFEASGFADTDEGFAEVMWVHVTDRRGDRLVGTLDNVPISIPRLGWGSTIKCSLDDIVDYDTTPARWATDAHQNV